MLEKLTDRLFEFPTVLSETSALIERLRSLWSSFPADSLRTHDAIHVAMLWPKLLR